MKPTLQSLLVVCISCKKNYPAKKTVPAGLGAGPEHRVGVLVASTLKGMVDESLRHDTRVVVAAAVAALSSSGDKYGAKLHAWLANVVDGERPSTVPRLDDLRLSIELFQRREKVRAVVKGYRDLLNAHWKVNNSARKAKRKGERQAERRQVRRQLEGQHVEPTSADGCSDGGCSYGGMSDDADCSWPLDNPPNDGPAACSDYELERLRTIVANAHVLVTMFGAGQYGEEEAAKAAEALRLAVEQLEAQEAINQAAAQHRMEDTQKAQRQSQLEAAARCDAWQD